MPPAPPAGEVDGAVESARPLVLVVDDSERNLRLAVDVLRAASLDTLEATTAADAIALAHEHLPDVILMDLQLPDLGGLDAARVLHDSNRTAGIPVVALTAMRLGEDPEWLVAAGFAGVLAKPIDVRTFSDEVRRHCGRSPA